MRRKKIFILIVLVFISFISCNKSTNSSTYSDLAKAMAKDSVLSAESIFEPLMIKITRFLGRKA